MSVNVDVVLSCDSFVQNNKIKFIVSVVFFMYINGLSVIFCKKKKKKKKSVCMIIILICLDLLPAVNMEMFCCHFCSSLPVVP